jgi:hypothetical protein
VTAAPIRILPDSELTSGGSTWPARAFSVLKPEEPGDKRWAAIGTYSLRLCKEYELPRAVCGEVAFALYNSAQDWPALQPAFTYRRPRHTGDYVIDSTFAFDTYTTTTVCGAWGGTIHIGKSAGLTVELEDPLNQLRSLVQQIRRLELPPVSAQLQAKADQVVEQLALRQGEDIEAWVRGLTNQVSDATD